MSDATAEVVPAWDLTRMYVNDQDPQMEIDRQAVAAATQAFIDAWSNRSDYLTDLVVLREALDAFERLNRLLNTIFYEDGATRPGYYYTLRVAQNLADDVAQQRLDEITQWEDGLRESVRFFPERLATATPMFRAAALVDLRLEPYRVWLRQCFMTADHSLSTSDATRYTELEAKAEDGFTALAKLLSGRSAVVWNGKAMAEMSFNGMTSLLESPDPRSRETAAAALTAIGVEVATEATTRLNEVLAARLALARLRGYETVEIARFRQDGIDPAIIDTLVATAAEHYWMSHEYYALRAELNGLRRLGYPLRAAPIGRGARVTFEKAARVVRRVYARFGPWFVERFDEALATGRIDAQARMGKRGGAACWAPGIDLPPYLNLSFTGTLRDVQALAHEFGHYLEALLKRQTCNSLNYKSPDALAEVCGLFIELAIIDELQQEADLDDEVRLVLLLAALEIEAITIFRASAATTLERDLYRGIASQGSLHQDEIDALFTAAMQECFGDAVAMEGFEKWWVPWRHLLRGFYNCGYVFAALVARALRARMVENPQFINKVVEVMGSGARFTPQEILAHAGIDITDPALWRSGLESWYAMLEEAKVVTRRLERI